VFEASYTFGTSMYKMLFETLKTNVANVFIHECNYGRFCSALSSGLYCPEDSSEHHTRRRENLKSHMADFLDNFCFRNFYQYPL
jgi:hypothetical protein